MRAMAFDPFREVRATPAIILGDRELRSLRALVERHAGGPASARVEQVDAELQRPIVIPQAQVRAEVVGIGSRVAFWQVDDADALVLNLALAMNAAAVPWRSGPVLRTQAAAGRCPATGLPELGALNRLRCFMSGKTRVS